MPALRPRLLTIGTHHLRTRGVTVRHSSTVLDGYVQALRALDRTQPAHPAVILLDLHAHEPGFPELAASQLAAVLTSRMQAGTLHPTWLIGVATDPTPDLDAEAQLAGCPIVVRAPITDEQRRGLICLAATPALIPSSDPARRAYALAAERVLAAVRVAQIPLWTAKDVTTLLGLLTRYPVPRDADTCSQARADAKRVLRAIGGPRAADRRLRAIADVWQTRYPLHAEILRMFLDGQARSEIVRSFVNRSIYEDSRIYAGVKELPHRIAHELHMQARMEEA